MVCENCETEFSPKSKRGPKRRFCEDKCRLDYHNWAFKTGKAIVERKLKAKAAPKKESRFVNLGGLQIDARLGALADAARRLGIKEEGSLLQHLRRQKAAGLPLSAPNDGNQYEIQ